MGNRSSSRPTDAELEILSVLWRNGPSTVRDVHAAINALKPTGYTTVLKLLQIMIDKGLVRRDESERAHVYEARFGQEQTQRQLLDDLLERAFEGSASKLVMQALSSEKATTEELAEIKRLLKKAERGAK
ncbi:MAG: BlaI/MecI/CopY family transcriptional regulator [Pyrinomonadaceae bacterium]|nr:BlaI/MecI/CopY family transcriptional regulator [Pyrinomonadaceae bacterium]